METIFEAAAPSDIEELLGLYFSVYGRDYPLPLGTDRNVMARMISSPDTLWMVDRDPEERRLVGSALIEADPVNRIGRLVITRIPENPPLCVVDPYSIPVGESFQCANVLYEVADVTGPFCVVDGGIEISYLIPLGS